MLSRSPGFARDGNGGGGRDNAIFNPVQGSLTQRSSTPHPVKLESFLPLSIAEAETLRAFSLCLLPPGVRIVNAGSRCRAGLLQFCGRVDISLAEGLECVKPLLGERKRKIGGGNYCQSWERETGGFSPQFAGCAFLEVLYFCFSAKMLLLSAFSSSC